MAQWIEELASVMEQQFPHLFRRTPEKHWQFKIGQEWVTAPDHYKTGLLLMFAGSLGLGVLDPRWKLLSTTSMAFGSYLFMDDVDDFRKDVAQGLEALKKLFSS